MLKSFELRPVETQLSIMQSCSLEPPPTILPVATVHPLNIVLKISTPPVEPAIIVPPAAALEQFMNLQLRNEPPYEFNNVAEAPAPVAQESNSQSSRIAPR